MNVARYAERILEMPGSSVAPTDYQPVMFEGAVVDVPKLCLNKLLDLLRQVNILKKTLY